MSSKYASLPDIDTSPDIYESPDVTTPQVNLRKIVEDKPSEYIIADDIDIQKTSQIFREKTGETTEKDDTLNLHTKKLLKKYQLETFLDTNEYEILDKGSNLKETPLQKVRRLLFEVDSLQQEINDNDKGEEANDQNHSALVSMISSIQQQLTKISSKIPSGSSAANQTSTGSVLLSQIKSLDEMKEETEKTSIKSASKGSKNELEPSYALELESRLSNLEKTLGSNLITKAEMGENLGIGQSITQMEDMMKILSHPDHMETTIKKVKTLNGELDRLVELKDSLDANNKDDLYFGLNSSGVQPDAETESKLNKLFDLYEKLDSYMLLAPGILNRLQTLNGVHNEAIGAVDSIKALTNDQTRLQSILDVTKEQTTQLETSFNENHQTIKTNMELLDARIKDLITRIDKLSPQ